MKETTLEFRPSKQELTDALESHDAVVMLNSKGKVMMKIEKQTFEVYDDD